MSVQRLDIGTCVALVDMFGGEALMVLPHERDNATLDPMRSDLRHAETLAALRHLDACGIDPAEACEETENAYGLMSVGHTVTGREIVGLYVREPIYSQAELCEVGDLYALARAV